MSGIRILYGLDRLPKTLADDDDRLPAVVVGPDALRLNSFPLPVAAWTGQEADHEARMATVRAWLLSGCGAYDAALRRRIGRYLDAIDACMDEHRDGLQSALARFDGLYRAEDWCWSALRPLPRAWWRQDGTWVRADIGFWDGTRFIAMGARDFDSGELPPALGNFWLGHTLPVSPFRRPVPGVAPVRLSSP